MLNQMVIVGRLTDKPTVKESENGKKYSNVTIAVPRSYKNEEGAYDTDFIDCVLYDGIAGNTAEYCNKGDIVGIKGRVQTHMYEKDNEKRKSTEIIAEKVTFLSSKSKENENDDLEV